MKKQKITQENRPIKMLYCCLVEEQAIDKAFIQLYWAWGLHMGEAIEKIISTARVNGLKHPLVIEADLSDIEEISGEVSPSAEAEVFFATETLPIEYFTDFIFPTGVIPAIPTDEDEGDAYDIKVGYERSQLEDGTKIIDVIVSAPDLLPLYERLLKLNDAYYTFWYVLESHWDDMEEQTYENPNLTFPEEIIDHLLEHPHNALKNGFVSLEALAANEQEELTSVSITSHKRITISTDSDFISHAAEGILRGEGLFLHEKLVPSDNKVYYWSYRPSESLNRSDLISHLKANGFTLWESKS